MHVQETLDIACRKYIDVLNSPANAHGLHMDANGTRSCRILANLHSRFTEKAVQTRLKELFAEQ